jgi:transcriptional regulator with XRE-family HTH domain
VDLAGVRAGRKLSQREMADLLGVEQGTISKGEGKAGAVLGPALQEALGRLTAGVGAGAGVRRPHVHVPGT